MKNKKGFTLIELLAVIVILGVIMVIAIPFVMGYIEKSKRSSFEDTAYGIISSAQYYTTNLENGEEYVTSITCDYNKCGNLSFKGKVPSGVVNIYDDYTISLSITNGEYCAYKNGNETKVKVLEGKCTGVTVMQYAAGESEDETITNLQNQITALQNQLNSQNSQITSLLASTGLKNMDLITDSTVIATTTSASALVNVPNMSKYTYFMVIINNGGDRLGNILVHIPTLISTNQRYFANYSNGTFDAVAWIKYAGENQVYLARYTSVATSVMLYGIY
ncbi:MAG: type II secretion system protein [Bacilli bacterium]|nr:type II secretion system protein [Bacilli bacterium]